MQGSAADFCKAAMVALHARASVTFAGRLEACRLILQASALHHNLTTEIAQDCPLGHTDLPYLLAV